MTQGAGQPRPYIVTSKYILQKHAGAMPSLVVHLHPSHFRFDGQDSVFTYTSPMGIFVKHLKTKTIPPELLEQFNAAGVPFYDGCLIVQVCDHKSVAQVKDAARSASKTKDAKETSVHKYNPYITPSSYAPFPKDEPSEADANGQAGDADANAKNEESDKDNGARSVAGLKPRTFTMVLHPTPESLQRDLVLKASMPPLDAGIAETPGLNPPATPSKLALPTPTPGNMPPPAKRLKQEKPELEPEYIHAAEGEILLATTAPLTLEPKGSLERQIALLDFMAHPQHLDPPPEPKTRKRTVAEMAADEAAAAEKERYMLFLDERPGVNSAQAGATTDSDGQTTAAGFEPTFERFKMIAQIKQELSEKKEQEKLKQQENDRKLQLQRQQQADSQAQKQQNNAEKARREAAALREAQARQQQQQQAQQQAQQQQQHQQQQQQQAQQAQEAQRQAMAARANQNKNQVNGVQQQQVPNAQMANGMPHANAGGMPMGANPNMAAAQQARFQALSQQQAQASASPVIRQGTPQAHSSPMVNPNMAIPQTSASPPRPSSVVQNPPMAVPMAHNMSARGSQQSHPSNTPRIPHSTPNMAHGTPVNRQAMAATPRMTQASPPPNMMQQNSQHMPQAIMMNNQNMSQNPQFMAQLAHQHRLQQQQQNMQQINMQQMSPQQQQQMLQFMQQRQAAMAQQQQQQQQQHQQHQQQNGMMSQQQLAQQYSQQLQNMAGGQMRAQMTPQQLQMMQQQMRMQQMGGNGMHRQVSNPQMMNGSHPNMQAMAMQMQQQQQQQQLQQQQQHAAQQQRMAQQQQQNPAQLAINNMAQQHYMRSMAEAANKYGGKDNIPPDTQEQYKQQALQRAQQAYQKNQQNVAIQRQQMMMAQQQQNQQNQQNQQQQQAAMQMGMMGQQPM